MLTMLPCRREWHFKSVRLVLEWVWFACTQVWHTYRNDVTKYNHILSKCLNVQIEMRGRKNTLHSIFAENCCLLFIGNMFWIMFVQSLMWIVIVQILHCSPCFLKIFCVFSVSLICSTCIFLPPPTPLSELGLLSCEFCILCLCMSLQFILFKSF